MEGCGKATEGCGGDAHLSHSQSHTGWLVRLRALRRLKRGMKKLSLLLLTLGFALPTFAQLKTLLNVDKPAFGYVQRRSDSPVCGFFRTPDKRLRKRVSCSCKHYALLPFDETQWFGEHTNRPKALVNRSPG